MGALQEYYLSNKTYILSFPKKLKMRVLALYLLQP